MYINVYRFRSSFNDVNLCSTLLLFCVPLLGLTTLLCVVFHCHSFKLFYTVSLRAPLIRCSIFVF